MEADGVADTHQEHSTRELNDHLMRLLVDSKKWQDFPQAFQIMTCIVRMDKKVPGVRKSYDKPQRNRASELGRRVRLVFQTNRNS